MLTCLPQHAPDAAARAAERRAAAAALRYDYSRFPGIAMLPEVPAWAEPELAWLAMVGERLVEVAVNATAVDGRLSTMHPEHPDHHSVRQVFAAAGRGGARAAFDLLFEIVQGLDVGVERGRSLRDFEALFATMPLPAAAATALDDRSFARLRVAGPNPMSLSRVAAWPDVIDDAAFARGLAANGLPPLSLAAAAAEGRLYAVDFRGLAGVQPGTWAGGDKALAAPYALFVAAGDDRALWPAVIAVAPGRVVTAADGWAWQIAKTFVNVADGNVHQAEIHLARTHLVLEAAGIGLYRQLAAAHPVRQLLDPHLEGTFYINDAAESRLTGPGGGVDKVMAAPIATSRAVAVDAVKRWDFAGSMLEADLRARGVDDPTLLPDYPYRDDARLVFGAVRDWVEDYLRIWYTTDAEVLADAELQAWIAEMGAADGGRLAGVPAVRSVAALVAVVSHLVFTASAQHAAVNFPQGPLMAFAPGFPLSAYAPVGEDEAAYYAALPPLALAQLQGALGALLGGVHHTQLGRYHVPVLGHFAHEPRTAAPLAALHARLEAVERTITARNRGRAPYPFLLPSQIPQSTNI